MNLEIKGVINWVDFRNGDIVLFSFKGQKKLKVNIFIAIKELNWMSFALGNKLLEIVAKSKGMITVKGYCYNSETIIAEQIDFSNVSGFNQFVQIANDTRKEHKSEN